MPDPVALRVLHSQLVNICEEMGLATMRTSYSPIFSEGLDFCCLILNRDGELVAMQNLNPAMTGQALYSGRWVVDDVGAENFDPGDVIIHNDPYRGGSHMPEHLVITPFFHEGELRGWLCNIAHVAEIGGMAPGSFSANATEVYQEGLRLPPVKIERRGEPVRDVWRIMLANHRTPDHSWGDFNAMIGSLKVGARRLEQLFDEHGPEEIERAIPALFDYSETWIRRDIAELADGTYSGEDSQEDDGFEQRAYTLRADLTIDGDHLLVDWSRTDPQARGAINAPYPVTASATYTGIFQVIGSGAPFNSGAIRPIDIVARPGTVVNVRHPGACVGGQTELQPRIVEIIQGKILSQVAPERTSAASGGTSGNFLFGGVHPRTGHYYTNYHFEGMGWGGRAETDGNNAQIVPHGNCRNTPVEVFESRYPWTVHEYRLNDDAGGAGRTRGGLGVTRILEVEADEITVSALCDRSKISPWGVHGGLEGDRLAYLVKRVGSDEFLPFSEAFGTVSDTKFSNVRLRRGDLVMLHSPSGGGYGPPTERDPEKVADDVRNRFVSAESAFALYGVVLDEGGEVDVEGTRRRRRELSDAVG
ncbi:MAG: hydantoinase B/oxoprolinase family protein [Gaiellales bacterium]